MSENEGDWIIEAEDRLLGHFSQPADYDAMGFTRELRAIVSERLATAEAQRDRLSRALRRYGSHQGQCADDYVFAAVHNSRFCCICGFDAECDAALAAAPLPDAYVHPNATGTNVVPPRGAAAPLERDCGVTPPRRDGDEAASGGASALAGAPDVARDDRNAEADLHATRASGSPAASAQAATPSLPGSPAISEPTGETQP